MVRAEGPIGQRVASAKESTDRTEGEVGIGAWCYVRPALNCGNKSWPLSILGSDTTCSEDSCDQQQLIVQIIAVNGLSGTAAFGRKLQIKSISKLDS